jgi:hypothetical protein
VRAVSFSWRARCVRGARITFPRLRGWYFVLSFGRAGGGKDVSDVSWGALTEYKSERWRTSGRSLKGRSRGKVLDAHTCQRVDARPSFKDYGLMTSPSGLAGGGLVVRSLNKSFNIIWVSAPIDPLAVLTSNVSQRHSNVVS